MLYLTLGNTLFLIIFTACTMYGTREAIYWDRDMFSNGEYSRKLSALNILGILAAGGVGFLIGLFCIGLWQTIVFV